MNLINIPNFNEGKIIFKILDNLELIKQKYRDKYDITQEIYRYGKNKEHSVKRFDYNQDFLFDIDYNRISGLFDLFHNVLDLDLSRFVEERIINVKLITKIKEKYVIDNSYHKTLQSVKRKANVKIKVLMLRESCIEYLKWRVKDVNERKLSIVGNYFYPYSKDGTKFVLSKETYLKIVDELKNIFDYHNSKVNNATLSETIEYHTKRLLSQDIVLKSHEEMRRERENGM